MYNIPANSGAAKIDAYVGDSLKRPTFFTREKGTLTYVDYTGYNVTCQLVNIRGEVEANAAVTVATATPPKLEEDVDNSKISIFIGASDMPTKTGNYALVFKKVSQGNSEDVETFLTVRVVLKQPFSTLT